jgi:hypothetical protein
MSIHADGALKQAGYFKRWRKTIMRKISIMALALLLAGATLASGAIAAEGYEILFKGTTSRLSKKEKQEIVKQLGFRLSRDKKRIVDGTCGDVSPKVEVTDLNGDGLDEVFVEWGNLCTSGNTGRSISLFIKDPAGQYAGNLGFPAFGYEKLATRNKGFPDLLFGGPGFCHGVWQWTGTKYDYKCSIEETPGGCAWKDVKTVCQ